MFHIRIEKQKRLETNKNKKRMNTATNETETVEVSPKEKVPPSAVSLWG
jgi:hypothetical protein